VSFYGQSFYGGGFHEYNHQEPYVGVSVFFGGEFFDGGFYQPLEELVEEVEVVKTGGKGDNDKKRRNIFKPTGLPPEGRKTVEQRVQATREIHREVLKLSPKPLPVVEMSLAQIDAEIGERLRASLRNEEEEILMLLAAAVAG
jgi:hypothetical protein